MTKNKLFSLRLSEEVIADLKKQFPDKSTVAAVRTCIELVLWKSDLDMYGNKMSIHDDVWARLYTRVHEEP